MARLSVACFFLSFAFVMPATADTGPDTKQTDAPKEKKVCRSIASLGSKIPNRICMTQAQWDANARDAQQQVEADVRNRRFVGQ